MRFPNETTNETSFDGVVAVSTAMQQVVARARRAASVESPVLLIGEPGTGKHLLALRIHQASHRRNAPFIHFCAAGPGDVDRELFGEVVETLTELVDGRGGALQAAEGGTLFLEDIDTLSRVSQARLLSALEAGKAAGGDRIGGAVGVRPIASASRALVAAVERGAFRSDLFYHLSVIGIEIPPLRERPEDIPLLVREFLMHDPPQEATPSLRLEPRMMRALATLDWPGNVAQLRAVVESIAATVRAPQPPLEGLTSLAQPMAQWAAETDPSSTDATLAAVEREAVRTALRLCDGSRIRAARSLGISVRTLQRKLKRWHLADD